MGETGSRAVIWISRILAPTEHAYVLAEEACAAHAFVKGLLVVMKVWSPVPVAAVNDAYGSLHETLRRYDATDLIVPSAEHIHIRSARRWACVYAVAGDDEWSRETPSAPGQRR